MKIQITNRELWLIKIYYAIQRVESERVRRKSNDYGLDSLVKLEYLNEAMKSQGTGDIYVDEDEFMVML